MADNVTANPGAGGATFASDDIGGVQYPRVKPAFGVDGVATDVSAANPLPVTLGLTDAQLRATPVPVSGTVGISGNVEIVNDIGSPIPISSASTLAVNQAGVSASGSLTGVGQTATLSLTGATGWAVDLRGPFGGTVIFEGTVDGTNFFTIAVLPIGGGSSVASVTTATAPGAWWGNATGCQQVRARCSAYTSGTITAVVRAMQAAGVVSAFITGAATTPVSGTVTAGTGSNAIGDVGIQYRATSTGAASSVSVLSPATPAAATIKGSAGRLLGWQLQNGSAAVRSVKLFNATAPTLGTTAAVFEIDIPAGGKDFVHLPGGIGFATAMTYSVTSAKGLTDNTATGLAANDVSGSFIFS